MNPSGPETYNAAYTRLRGDLDHLTELVERRRTGEDDGPTSPVREPRRPLPRPMSGGAAMEIPREEVLV